MESSVKEKKAYETNSNHDIGQDNNSKCRPIKEEDTLSHVIDKMTQEITHLYAAECISKEDFPKRESLPYSKPYPFTNFGHQPLFDFELFLTIIWATINDIKNVTEIWINKNRKMNIKIFFIVLVIGMTIGIVLNSFILGLIALLISVFMGLALKSKLIENPEKAVAKIRASAISDLIYGQWNKGLDDKLKHIIDQKCGCQGSGKLSEDKIPVLVIENDSHPFPGYGRLQAESTFTCPPKDNKISENAEFEKITQKIFEFIKKDVLGMGIANISFGEVLVVHGNSLSIDSPLLDEDKVPHLRIQKKELVGFLNTEKDSARVYKAIQVFFPNYMTVATFFVRAFLAGNAVSCNVSVTTLGPPIKGIDFFKSRLLRHCYEIKERDNPNPLGDTNDTGEKTDPDNVFYLLRLAKLFGKSEELFQGAIIPEEIRSLKLMDVSDMCDAAQEKYARGLAEIIEESVYWPGSHLYSNNLREDNSYTFTTDFFGRIESIATIKAIYDGVSKSLIDGMDEIGFDTSNYRDSDGHYAINADKIDQLIVGEKISVIKSKDKNKENVQM